MDYLDQFSPYGIDDVKSLRSRIEESTGTPKCFFLGRDKGRSAAINSIAKQLRGLCCVTDFYIVKDKSTKFFSEFHVNEGFIYNESIEMSIRSNFLLDIPQAGQVGMTLRALESIFLNKKLITTNSEIKSQAFFKPENVFIIGKDNFDELYEFIHSKATVLPEQILHQFSPDHMLKKITADMK
jgi:1,5-rhamnosyltransferase